MCDRRKSLFFVILGVLAGGGSSVLRGDTYEEVGVPVGQEFTIDLASNPSTGYSWVLAGSLPDWLQQVDKTYVADNPGLPGGGGTEHWTFQATKPGSATLTFQYKRPGGGTPADVYTCQITATLPTDTENIFVAAGENFTVALASNPSTGYSWALADALPNWLVQVSKTYAADTPGLTGGGGTEYWTFRAAAAGSTALTFQYERPWEGTPIKAHVCQVTAASPADMENISVTVGQAFTVDLASNPSTGYSWALAQSLPSWLVQVDKTYVATNSGVVGGGGTEHWTFRATAAGSVTLIFQYQRPWEGTPVQTHVCQVTAAAPADKEDIFVAAGEDLTVALASNPSTGYSWTLADALPKWLVQVSKTYVADTPGLIGGGGTEYWTFRATAAGSATLTFQYERPWEGTPIQTHVCQVTAAAPADIENISVAVGQAFTVDLASNPSTGYSWSLAQSLPSWLVQVDKTYVATNSGVVGGGGTEHWTFRATAAGSVTLIFQYERPWEGTPAQVHVCQVAVRID